MLADKMKIVEVSHRIIRCKEEEAAGVSKPKEGLHKLQREHEKKRFDTVYAQRKKEE